MFELDNLHGYKHGGKNGLAIRTYMSKTSITKPVGKQALYSMLSSRAKKTILRLVELSGSNNENVALGACKVLLNKTIPDVTSIRITDLVRIEESKAEKKDEREFESMTAEEKRSYGLQMIEAGMALAEVGKYAPYVYDKGEIKRVESNCPICSDYQ